MKNRVITLKQPWASLVANGLKIYEFRNMNYSYRGKILIHAGKGIDKDAMDRVKEYNLDYYALFPGCSSSTEPSMKTLKYIIDKITF